MRLDSWRRGVLVLCVCLGGWAAAPRSQSGEVRYFLPGMLYSRVPTLQGGQLGT
jgi:hypothetical protein